MNWFKRLIVKWVREDWDDGRYSNSKLSRDKVYPVEPVTLGPDSMEGSLRLNVLPARGGTVVEIRKYDTQRDRNYNLTYVIPDGDDVALEIGKIVNVEIMKL